MRVKLSIRGQGVDLLVSHLQQKYGWVFEDMAQVSYFKGYAIGTHPVPDDFFGYRINDGTYVFEIEYLGEEGNDGSEQAE